MSKKQSLLSIPIEQIAPCILMLRGHRVMIDRDLAALYSVETRILIQAVKRNLYRFPKDFMFQLSKLEFENWISQFVISNSASKMGLRKRPYAFTEQGVAMLSSVLRSPHAVTINVEIMRAFVRMRHFMTSQKEITKELAEVKSFLLKHSNSSDREFKRIWQAIEKLSSPPTQKERQIGFKLS